MICVITAPALVEHDLNVDRIWLASYPPGVPADVDAHIFASLTDLLERSCEQYARQTAFACLGAKLSYAELETLSRQFAAFLLEECSLSRGDRIAIMLPNLLQYPVALFGAWRAGLVVVNVNPLYTADELSFQLADSGAAAIVVLENFAHTLEQALPSTRVRHVIVARVGDLLPLPRRLLANAVVEHVRHAVPDWAISGAVSFRSALETGGNRPFHARATSAEDIALLQYTGGTTGRAKGAVLTHGNILANVEQVAAWMSSGLTAGEESVVTALPLYHIFALTANLLLFVRLGGSNVLVPDARDLHALVRTLASTRYTAITGVNTLFKALLEAPGFDKVATACRGTLKVAVSGGMSLEHEVAQRWRDATGVLLMEGYGLTEASPVVCGNRLDEPDYTGKLGLPLPSTDVRIVRDDASEASIGELGEICVRGPQVMRGYWNVSAETAEAFTGDGWLRTGDIGWMDGSGYVEFVERRKDVIVVSGFKAYPSEIESVVMQHPGVKDAAAVATPDERTGEAVSLFVVKKDPALTAQAIREHCARHLTAYKRPKIIEFRDRLPKSTIGKTLRRSVQTRVGAHV